MTHLYIMRHGVAVERGNTDLPDDERPLTAQGEHRVRRIARGLERFGFAVDAIFTSPLPRAFRTAEIVADALGVRERLVLADQLRPARSPAEIRDWLETRDERRILIVGHDPSLSGLATLLIAGNAGWDAIRLHKGSIAAFVRAEHGAYTLDWLARPRLFLRLGGA